MVKKVIKKKKEQPKLKFYIIRAMKNGRESYRQLIDTKYFISWSALTNHQESVEHANQLLSWSTKYPDTFESMVKAHLEAQDEDVRDSNKYVLNQVLKGEPYYTTYGAITYEYEPVDDVKYEQVLEIQREHQRAERERLEAERLREQKERIKNRAHRFLKRKFA